MVKYYKSATKDDKGNKVCWSGEIDIDDSLYLTNEKRLLRDIAKLLGYTEDV